MNTRCNSVAQRVKPIEVLGEACGLVLLYGGTEALTKAIDGNPKEAAVVCSAWYLLGRLIYVVSEAAFVKCGICSPPNSLAAPRTFLQTIDKVMKYSLIGAVPAWSLCKTFFYPSLQIGTTVYYFAGGLAPYATLATVIRIIKDVQSRCLDTRSTPADPNGTPMSNITGGSEDKSEVNGEISNERVVGESQTYRKFEESFVQNQVENEEEVPV